MTLPIYPHISSRTVLPCSVITSLTFRPVRVPSSFIHKTRCETRHPYLAQTVQTLNLLTPSAVCRNNPISMRLKFPEPRRIPPCAGCVRAGRLRATVGGAWWWGGAGPAAQMTLAAGSPLVAECRLNWSGDRGGGAAGCASVVAAARSVCFRVCKSGGQGVRSGVSLVIPRSQWP